MSAPGPDRSAPAYDPAGPRALRSLGIDVYAPLANLRPAFEQVLPEATTAGYFGALQRAFSLHEARPCDTDDQLRWLADHLRLTAPATRSLSADWAQAWTEAAEALGQPAPEALSPAATRCFLDELLRLPRYRHRLTDALVVALRVELKQ